MTGLFLSTPFTDTAPCKLTRLLFTRLDIFILLPNITLSRWLDIFISSSAMISLEQKLVCSFRLNKNFHRLYARPTFWKLSEIIALSNSDYERYSRMWVWQGGTRFPILDMAFGLIQAFACRHPHPSSHNTSLSSSSSKSLLPLRVSSVGIRLSTARRAFDKAS